MIRRATVEAARSPLAGLVVLVVVVLVAGLAFVLIARDDSATSAEPLADLCTAARLAGSGDVEAADRTFFSRPHQPLHELAAALTAVDRPAAAALLEAKNRVEAALTGRSESAGDELVALNRETASALTQLGRSAPSCLKGPA